MYLNVSLGTIGSAADTGAGCSALGCDHASPDIDRIKRSGIVSADTGSAAFSFSRDVSVVDRHFRPVPAADTGCIISADCIYNCIRDALASQNDSGVPAFGSADPRRVISAFSCNITSAELYGTCVAVFSSYAGKIRQSGSIRFQNALLLSLTEHGELAAIRDSDALLQGQLRIVRKDKVYPPGYPDTVWYRDLAGCKIPGLIPDFRRRLHFLADILTQQEFCSFPVDVIDAFLRLADIYIGILMACFYTGFII